MKKLQYVVFLCVILLNMPSWAQTFGDSPAVVPVPPKVSEKAKPQVAPQKKETDDIPAEISDIQKALQTTVAASGKTQSYDPFALMSRGQSGNTDVKADSKSSDDAELPPTDEDDEFFVPPSEINERLNTPTVDGSPRGGQAFVMVDKDGNVKKITNIFLFYE